MKINRIITQFLVLIAALAVPFTQVQAASPTQQVKMEGVIVSRDANNVVLRSAAGNINLKINAATKVEAKKGLGLRYETMTPAALVPGLSINVEAETTATKETVAKSITFHVDDLKRASEIQAALAVPQQEAAALKQEAEALKAKVEAQNQVILAQEKQLSDVDKRFDDLADYDQKAEMVVHFDINSANLSETAKAELQAFAEKAKTFKGYLIQVAGYTDSTGTADHNQQLSDRRAESVVTYLRQSCDVGMSRVLAPVAMASAKAVAPNETAQGKAENRRVTVKLAVNRGIAQ